MFHGASPVGPATGFGPALPAPVGDAENTPGAISVAPSSPPARLNQPAGQANERGWIGGHQMLLARRMRQFWTLLTICMVALSLFATTTAHAGESFGCVDTGTALEIGHAEGDRDQVPADDGKGYPHHHGGCQGHQIAAPAEEDSVLLQRIALVQPIPTNSYARPAATADPALKPPQA